VLLFSLLRATYVLEAAEGTTQVRDCTVLGSVTPKSHFYT
jgi:hypothetical protein